MQKSIIQWNLQGYSVTAKYDELKLLIQEYEPACVALQELNFGNDKHSINYSPKNYNLFHSSQVGRLGAGLLIRSDIPTVLVPLNSIFQYAVAAKVHLDKTYTVCSIYIPPRFKFKSHDLIHLLRQLPEPFILLGDFNCRDPLWGDVLSSHEANEIRTTLNKFPVEILNDGSFTHYHLATGTETAIDLSLVSPSCMVDFEWSVLEKDTALAYGSDHYPIILKNLSNSNSCQKMRWCYQRADWSLFESLTKIDDSSLPDFNNNNDEFAKFITEKILSAAEKSIPKTRYSLNNNVPWWNEEIANAIRNRKKASRKMKRSKSKQDHITFKRYRAIARKTLIRVRKESLRNFISSINCNTPISKIWKKIKKFHGKYRRSNPPIIKNNNRDASSPKESAEWIAQSFAEISSGNFPPDQVKKKINMEKSKPDFSEHGDKADYNEDYQMRELRDALSGCNKSAAGPDDVSYEMISHCHPSIIQILLKLYNNIWNSHNIPAVWKEATVIPVLKPGKISSDVKSYRPISLTSCLGKLFEKMVSTRLTFYLESKNLLSNNQFGFRQAYSTMHPISRLFSKISEAFNKKQIVIAVFFDLEKAYDTTWRHGLIMNLHKLGIKGNMSLYLDDFLKHRTFRVQLGDSLSDQHVLKEGIPQGSVLSTLLFDIAINDILNNIPKEVEGLLYADDLTLSITAERENLAVRQMQLTINKIVKWASERGYKFSTAKTKMMIFSKRRERIVLDVPLKLYGKDIERVRNFKFLGVYFDEKLTFIPHIENLILSCSKPLALMNHLSHLSWGTDRKTLTTIYNTLVQSKLDYGSAIYSSTASKKYIQKLNVVRNKGLRIITGAFRSTPIDSLHVETNMIPPSYGRPLSAYKWYLQFQQREEFFVPSLFDLEKDNLTDFQKDIKRIKEDVGNLEITKLSFKTPPWKVPEAQICSTFNSKKKDSNIDVLRTDFKQHLEVSHDKSKTIHVFTDASKTEKGVGAAVFIPLPSIVEKKAPLNQHFSIFSAECVAIILALKVIFEFSNKFKRFTVFSDSYSVIQSIKKFNPKHPYVKEIQEWLQRCHSVFKDINFCWVPSHVGIPGNEHVDKLAKDSISDIILPFKVFYKDAFPSAKKSVRRQWQQYWSTQTDNKLNRIKPRLAKWNTALQPLRRNEVILCRLRCGHTNFSHSYLMNRSAVPQCPFCSRSVLTIDHIFSACQGTLIHRRSLFRESLKLREEERTANILSEGKDLNLSKIIKFLEKLNIYSKI